MLVENIGVCGFGEIGLGPPFGCGPGCEKYVSGLYFQVLLAFATLLKRQFHPPISLTQPQTTYATRRFRRSSEPLSSRNRTYYGLPTCGPGLSASFAHIGSPIFAPGPQVASLVTPPTYSRHPLDETFREGLSPWVVVILWPLYLLRGGITKPFPSKGIGIRCDWVHLRAHLSRRQNPDLRENPYLPGS